jgi:hypothetical protein
LKRLVTYHFVLSGSYEYNTGRHFTTSILAADVLIKHTLQYPPMKCHEKVSTVKKAEKGTAATRKTKPASEEYSTTIKG